MEGNHMNNIARLVECVHVMIELNQRAHSPQLAAGLASEAYKMANSLHSKIPCSLLQGASIP
jgi:hypothetical protein